MWHDQDHAAIEVKRSERNEHPANICGLLVDNMALSSANGHPLQPPTNPRLKALALGSILSPSSQCRVSVTAALIAGFMTRRLI